MGLAPPGCGSPTAVHNDGARRRYIAGRRAARAIVHAVIPAHAGTQRRLFASGAVSRVAAIATALADACAG